MNAKEYRKGRNLSQEEFAATLRITQSHLCKIEAGKARPSAELADRIQRATGGLVTLSDLLPKKKRRVA